jgi:hypothetical protein
MKNFEQRGKEILHAELSAEELKQVRATGCTIADYAFLKKAGIIRNIADLQLLAQQPNFADTLNNLRHMPLKKAVEYFEEQKKNQAKENSDDPKNHLS